MIKVPATEAGIPAIEELTARGVNVNVTLLFSVARYEQVIDAYVAGLERRLGSRRAGRRDRLGRLVLRLARRHQGRRRCSPPTRTCAAAWRSPTPSRAYARYRERFADERWHALREAGARPQRPLWASTGTKDPAYSDVLYVEELIAPDVINTMPEATLRAFADHGDVDGALRIDAERPTRRSAAPPQPASTSPPSPPSSSAKACTPSATPTDELLTCIETKAERVVLAP